MSMHVRLHRRRSRAGFTLMEVLLVLAILVILGSLVAMSFKNVISDSDVKATKSQIGLLETPINTYWMHTKHYPTSLQSLITAPADVDPTKWKGPYLDKGLPKDPWGGEYKIRAPGTYNPTSFDVWSAGPDAIDGTADDVGNWEQAAVK
ncbi:MAG: type II secretion system major pseudopilin GspG [Planctomycetia bacterium]|nr:type II secretion system major pseudopilin GspG [Planctomycetia bacterium]